MPKALTVQEFFKKFPDDDSCLDHLMVTRFGRSPECPKCHRTSKFHRIRKRPVYECQWCGHQISPMVGTPFQRSSTPLQKWFYAMYLFTTSRHGVPAKELQRQLGVTYKTAWRMGHEIRKYMARIDGMPPLDGHVEMDEAYFGGKRKSMKRTGKSHLSNKTAVFGMLERDGQVYTTIIPNARRETLIPEILKQIPKGTRISTDKWRGYHVLKQVGYDHQSVNHGGGEYVRGDTHTNSIEGFWARLKLSIRGTHVHVSGKHLAKYLGEFEFRFNLRKTPELMFDRLLASF